MPQYRVEISPNNRAGCKDSVCNKGKIKITKGEIRFGTWVEIQDHGSWAWKHWGCVSGSQLQNLKDECENGDDDYDFDAIDGYDEIEDADVREKVRRCVKQAHIDPEDFKGDPEKNVPGEKGIHLTAKQKAAKEKAAVEAEEHQSEDEEPKRKTAKRSRRNGGDEDKLKAKKAKTAAPAKEGAAATAPKARANKTKTRINNEEESGDVEQEEDENDVPVQKTSKGASKTSADLKKAAKSGRGPAKRDTTDGSGKEKTAKRAKGHGSSKV